MKAGLIFLFLSVSMSRAALPLPSWVAIALQIDPKAYQSLEQSPRAWIQAQALIEGVQFTNIALHIKGTLGSKTDLREKPSWTLNLDKYSKGQKWLGLDKLHLNNSLQDPTYISQILGLDLYRTSGLPAARGTHAWVTLNGSALGMYVLVEGYDKTFLKREFDDSEGLLYEGGRGADIDQAVLKSGIEPRAIPRKEILFKLSSIEDDNERLENLAKAIDIDLFHTFLALETITSHWDGYAMNKNNFMAYLSFKKGAFVFLPHGLDTLFQYPSMSIYPDCAGQVAYGIFETAQGRQAHLSMCQILLSNSCSWNVIAERTSQLAHNIRSNLSTLNRTQLAEWERQYSVFTNRIRERIMFLSKHISSAPTSVSLKPGESIALEGFEANVNWGKAAMKPQSSSSAQWVSDPATPFTPCKLAWRKHLVLAPGEYILSASYRAVGFVPVLQAPGKGIFLRAYGNATPSTTYKDLSDGWTFMETRFDVRAKDSFTVLSADYWGMNGKWELSDLMLSMKSPP